MCIILKLEQFAVRGGVGIRCMKKRYSNISAELFYIIWYFNGLLVLVANYKMNTRIVFQEGQRVSGMFGPKFGHEDMAIYAYLFQAYVYSTYIFIY